MSERVGNIVIIAEEPDGTCELCGKVEETRPYGPNGERICWDCGQKNPAARDRVMKRVLFGETDA